MRPWYWTIIALVVLAIAVWVLFGRGGAAKSSVPSPQAVQTTKDLLTKPYTEHGAGYDISAAYPTTTPMGEAAAEEMQEWVIGEIGHFKDSLASSTHSSLTITYEASSTNLAASYLFTVTEDGHISTKAFTFTAPKTP